MSTSVGATVAASVARQVQTRIRLSRKGCANRPFYHIVIVQKGRNVNANPIEQIGSFDPLVNRHNEKLVAINVDRLKYWLAQGSIPSNGAGQLLGLSGFLPIHPRTYLDSRRRQAEAIKAVEAAEAAKAEEAIKAVEAAEAAKAEEAIKAVEAAEAAKAEETIKAVEAAEAAKAEEASKAAELSTSSGSEESQVDIETKSENSNVENSKDPSVPTS